MKVQFSLQSVMFAMAFLVLCLASSSNPSLGLSPKDRLIIQVWTTSIGATGVIVFFSSNGRAIRAMFIGSFLSILPFAIAISYLCHLAGLFAGIWYSLFIGLHGAACGASFYYAKNRQPLTGVVLVVTTAISFVLWLRF